MYKQRSKAVKERNRKRVSVLLLEDYYVGDEVLKSGEFHAVEIELAETLKALRVAI